MVTNAPSTDSPRLCSTILGSFLRGRPLISSQSAPTRQFQLQPTSRRVAVPGNASSPSPDPTATSPSQQLFACPQFQTPSSNHPFINHAHVAAPPAPAGTHCIRLVPHLESRCSLKFEAITQDLAPSSPALRIGRFTGHSGLGVSAVNALGSNKLAFRSKVVLRSHAEI
ncbi:hypothetical protein BT96DRAFT_1002314 [Gymnopus androsaceus JB14]|uniref:FHA domain-containing protein n=1 Tax=Gymnopus androsaceus JB14 TaxID=1447944 RepID=A0A6A4GYL9_9AGAR|nr:hypothetical protein BT96DRAFT_1002314 [Gymnopus androsaceus JB14]